MQSSEEQKDSKVVNIDKNNLDSSKMKTNTQESKSSFLILIIIIVICVIWYNSSKNKNDNSVNTSNITNEISTNSLNDNNTQSSATEDKWYEYERSWYDFSYYVPMGYFMNQSYSHIENSKCNMYFYFEGGGDEKKLSVDGSYKIIIDTSEGYSVEDELHYWSTAGQGEDCKTTTSEIVEENINGYNWKKINYKHSYNMETYTRYFTGIVYAIEFKGKCYRIIYEVDNHTGDIDTAILDSMKPTFRFI